MGMSWKMQKRFHTIISKWVVIKRVKIKYYKNDHQKDIHVTNYLQLFEGTVSPTKEFCKSM